MCCALCVWCAHLSVLSLPWAGVAITLTVSLTWSSSRGTPSPQVLDCGTCGACRGVRSLAHQQGALLRSGCGPGEHRGRCWSDVETCGFLYALGRGTESSHLATYIHHVPPRSGSPGYFRGQDADPGRARACQEPPLLLPWWP